MILYVESQFLNENMLLGTDFHDKPVDLSVVKVSWYPMYYFRSCFSDFVEGNFTVSWSFDAELYLFCRKLSILVISEQGRVRVERGRGPSLSVP